MYFHPASSDSSEPSLVTSSALTTVVSSTATHITPRLATIGVASSASPNRFSSGQYHAPQPDVPDPGPEVSDRVDRHHRVHERDRDQEHAAQAVEEERAAERVPAAADVIGEHRDQRGGERAAAAASAESQPLTGRSPITSVDRRRGRAPAPSAISSQTAISRAAPPCPRCSWSSRAPRSAGRTRRRTGPPGAGRAAAGSRSRTAAPARSPPWPGTRRSRA